MNALHLLAPGSLELRDIPVPQPGPDELLVKTGATTICTSDLADIRSNPFGIALPVVIGHEGAGTVVATGEVVQGFRPGDRVAAHPVHPCYACSECRRGLAHLCPNLSHFGIDRPGTFADYFVVRQDRARRIPDDVDFAIAALAEPICVSLEAVRRARLKSGDSLLIIGDGPFGLMMARIAARDPAVRVTIAGRHDFRLGLATGAETINVRRESPSANELIDHAGGNGFDAVILAVADPKAVALGLNVLRGRGRLVIFAPIHGGTHVDLAHVLMKELEILGAVNDEDLFDESIAMLADPGLRFADLITHRLPLAAFHEAIATAATGHSESIKTAFVFS